MKSNHRHAKNGPYPKARIILSSVILCSALLLSACSSGAIKETISQPSATVSASTAPVTASPAITVTPSSEITATADPTATPIPSLTFGAAGGNLLNGGSGCLYEGVFYGIQGITGGNPGIYAQHKDGNLKLTDGIGSQINIKDGFLYYVSYPKGLLYRVPTDGSEAPEKLSEDKMLFMLVADDSIYYTIDPSAALYVMKTDGTDKQLISGGKCYDLGGYGTLIYYTDSKAKTFCMLDTLTGNTTKIPMSSKGYAQIMDGRVYYQNEKDGKKLYCCNLDGSDNHVIFDKAVSGINVTDTAIYFANDGDQGKPYRMNLDGAGAEKIADVKAEFIQVYGQELYIVNNLKTGTIYRLNESGGLTKLE